MLPEKDLAQLKKKFKDTTLLIVDDSNELRRAVSAIFAKLGFTILEADGGRSAFNLFKKNKVNGVLSDIRMPDGDGIELLENIRKVDPTFPIVVLMSGFHDITIEEAVKKGAITILNKPSTVKSLIGTMIKAMNDALLSLDFQARDAVSCGQFEVLKSLVEKDRALLFKVDNFGDTLIHLAVQKKQWNIVRFFAEQEPQLVIEKNGDQVSSVQMVSEKAQWDLLKFLLSKLIANPSRLNRAPGELKSLLDFARERGAPAETLDEFTLFVKNETV